MKELAEHSVIFTSYIPARFTVVSHQPAAIFATKDTKLKFSFLFTLCNLWRLSIVCFLCL